LIFRAPHHKTHETREKVSIRNPQTAIRNRENSQFAIRNSQSAVLFLILLVLGMASAGAQQPSVRKVVVLDAGHGGDDNGVKAPGGTFEKDAALLMAGSLRKVLKEDAGLDAVLTREDDRRMSLEDRSVIANRSKPALFISLHGAYAHDPAAAGFLVYYYQPTPDQAERYHILKREVGGREVQLVPWDLAQFRWTEASKALAGALQLKLNGFHQQFSGAPVALPLEQLSTVNCPAVILEFAYFTNADQVQKAQDPAWREGCARAVREAVKEFLKSSQPILAGD
jgi:N-acetylmuramoyl-L-alanine amidase